MYFFVYVSSAVELFSPSELVDLLAKCREKNARLGVSGMLLYKDGNIMQVLEGELQAVRRLYDEIGRDARHRGLILLAEGALTTRQFPRWSMGFRDLNASEVTRMPGYSPFLNTPLTGAEFLSNPTRCHRLLTTFKNSM